jgi:hypothetical protein
LGLPSRRLYAKPKIYSLTNYAFKSATDDLNVRLRAEPSLQVLNIVERYSIYREEDTNLKNESTNLDDNEEEEDLLLKKKLEFFSKDIDILLLERLTKVKKEDLAREI